MSRFDERRTVGRERIVEIHFQLYEPREFSNQGDASLFLARAATLCPQRNCNGEGEFIYGGHAGSGYSDTPQQFVLPRYFAEQPYRLPDGIFRSRHPDAHTFAYTLDATYCPKCGIGYAATGRQYNLIRSLMVEYLKSHGATVLDSE